MVFIVWFLGCRFESRRGRLIWFYFAYVYTLLVLGHAGILSRIYRCFLLVFSFSGTILIMVHFFPLFSLVPLWGGWSTACARAHGGQGLARSEPCPALHAHSLDVRDAQRSSTASRGWRLIGGVLELSSRCVEGILVFGGVWRGGKGGGERVKWVT